MDTEIRSLERRGIAGDPSAERRGLEARLRAGEPTDYQRLMSLYNNDYCQEKVRLNERFYKQFQMILEGALKRLFERNDIVHAIYISGYNDYSMPFYNTTLNNKWISKQLKDRLEFSEIDIPKVKNNKINIRSINHAPNTKGGRIVKPVMSVLKNITPLIMDGYTFDVFSWREEGRVYIIYTCYNGISDSIIKREIV